MAKKKSGTATAAAAAEHSDATKMLSQPAVVSEATQAQGGEAGAAKKKKKRRPKKKPQVTAEAAGETPSDDSDNDDVVAAQPTSGRSAGAAGSKAAAAYGTEGGSRLDPMELTIAECVKKGYSPAEVKQMINEMWDKGLPYDNPAEVMKALRMSDGKSRDDDEFEKVPPELLLQEAQNRAAPSPRPRSPQPAAQKLQQHKKDDKAKEPASPVPPPPARTAPAPPLSPKRPAPTALSPKGSPARAASVASPVQLRSQAQQPGPQEMRVPSYGERLEQAASSEDIRIVLDALNGFTEVCKPPSAEFDALFTSRTLDLLFRGVLKASLAHPKEFPSAIKGMLETFLKRSLGTSVPLNDLLGVVQQAQKLHEHGHRPLSVVVVDSLAAAMASALKEYRRRASSNQAALGGLPEVEARLGTKPIRLASASNRSKLSTRDLFALRDAHVEAVTLHETVCNILVGSMTPVGAQSYELIQSGEALRETILKDALDVSAEQLKVRRQQIAAAKEELASTSSIMEQQLKPMMDEAEGYKRQLVDLQGKKEALLRQLADLENDIHAVEGRVNAADAAVVDMRQRFESSLEEKNEKLKGMVSIVRRADEAEELSKQVEHMGMSLGQELARTQETQHEKLEGKLKKHLKSFAESLEAYLDVEVKCFDFLNNRVVKLEEEKAGISRDLAQYKSLGLQSTNQHLTAKVSELESYIAEDNGVIASLREKAQTQYKTLRAALDLLGGPGGAWQVNEVAPLIVPIKHGLDHLGLAKDWLPGLAPQMSPSGPHSAGAPVGMDPVVPMPDQRTQHNPNVAVQKPVGAPPAVSNGPSPIAPPVSAQQQQRAMTPPPQQQSPPPTPPPQQQQQQQALPPPNPTPTPPPVPAFKFSWANRAASAAAATGTTGAGEHKKSLREIQAEELQGRLTEENLRRLEQGKQQQSRFLAMPASTEAEASATGGTAVSSDGVAPDGAGAKDDEEQSSAKEAGATELNGHGLDHE